MRLSTKSRFAVTAMIDMGLRQHQGPVSLAAISQRQHISISYLEQIFSKMRQHGLVESTRGPGGGYTLNRDANHISVADIIYAVNSPDEKEQLSKGGSAPSNNSPKRGVFAQKPAASTLPKVPNSVFALGNA
jgi:Rrf2 family iron-sulfur cluster assembly transcriptional regulator